MTLTLIKRLAVCGGMLVLQAISTIDVHAQPTAPIYVQYEGFKREAGGGFLLWFSYFNLNHVDVTIPVGPDNEFSPAPGDRKQITTFYKGRHRFACTMMVPSAIVEPVQWTVRFAGTTSKTSARVFDPIYEMEEASVEQGSKGLDVSQAPMDVCVERHSQSD